MPNSQNPCGELTINRSNSPKSGKSSKKKSSVSSKKELNSTSEKYRYAYNFLFNSYEHWKQLALQEDLATNREDSYIIDEFVKEVIRIAEGETNKQL